MIMDRTWRFDFRNLGRQRKKKIDAAVAEVVKSYDGVDLDPDQAGEDEQFEDSITYYFDFADALVKSEDPPPENGYSGEFDFFADDEFGSYLMVPSSGKGNTECWDLITEIAGKVAAKLGGVEEEELADSADDPRRAR